MADSFTAITPGSGDNVDEESLTVSATTVKRQRMQIAGSAAAEIARVINTNPVGTEYGLVVRDPGLLDASLLSQALNMTSTANAVPLALNGAGTVAVQISGATWTGTIVFEIAVETGNYTSVPAVNLNSGGSSSTTTVNGTYAVNTAGAQQFRVRCTVAGTNSATVSIIANTSGGIATVASLPASTVRLGKMRLVDQADSVLDSVKGTQTQKALQVQEIHDSGRNELVFFTLIPVLTTATDTLQSLTGFKADAAVGATTTPAVVTAGKTFRITRFAATYIATVTSGYAIVRLRQKVGGTVAVTDPVMGTMVVGAGTPGTANSVGATECPMTEGREIAAGNGFGISVQGFAAVTATAVGYVFVVLAGYEY